MYVLLTMAADGWVVVRTPYNAVFLDAFKQAIPYTAREWQPTAKTWRIAPDWADALIDLVDEHGGTVIDKRPPPQTGGSVPKALGEACALLHVAPDAPLEVAQAAYKAMARKHHPDIGGDTTTMQALNEAIAIFKTYVGGH